MPALTANSQVGVREDLSDLIYLADVKETPFTSTVKKGKRPTNPSLWEYGVKRRGARKHGGVPDGKDVNAFDSQNPKDYLQARSEVWRRAPMVGFIAQITSRNGGVAGVTDQFDEAVADQLVEIKRDMETEFLSNQDSRPDDGVNGLWTRGPGRWLHNVLATNGDVLPLGAAATAVGQATTGFVELPIPTSYRTPANQIYDGSMGNGSTTGLTEDVLKNLIQAKWDNTGASSELRGFVTSAIKNRVGLFSRYEQNIAGMTPNLQVTTGRVSGTKLLGAMIDVYSSDWGTFTLHPVSTDFMPSAYTGYFLDMSQVQLRVTENVAQMELPNLGGGPREFIQSIIGLEMGDPRAHAKINATA
jgi:hypothetical protein